VKSLDQDEVPAMQVQLPHVDIIIAARNEARYIRSCLDALKAQDYPSDRMRIHVIDNGSTDATARIAAESGATVLLEPKPGAAAARNAGLKRASGELVGFLDAHCIVEKNWVRLMTKPFKSDDVGGCQGRMENRSSNRRVQEYLDASGALSNDRIVEDTITAKRNIYPWILSGNCMYRRAAVDEAGLFNESLDACEDVDLAWRVILLGYQLEYVPEAKLIHVSGDSWGRFVGKAFQYGKGAATLAAIYAPHGAREKFSPGEIWSTRPEKLLSGINYMAGYRWKELRLRVGFDSVPGEYVQGKVMGKFRTPFAWAPGISLRISESAIFWLRDGDQTSVIVHVPARLRIVLESAGNFIWRRIVRGSNRDAMIEAVTQHFGVAPITASTDLDEFVEELIESRILERISSADRQPASSSLGP
jgi:GT2 family glycosyltransferase